MRLAAALRRAALAGLVTSTVLAGACAAPFDTTRKAPAPLTLGDELYAILCDRLAASEDPFDLEGRNAREVCHADAEGNYADGYPEGKTIPPKVAVMVRYRADTIAALNAIFPDKENLQEDMQDLLKEMVPLYDDDTLPEATRTLAAIFDTISYDEKGKVDETAEQATARKNKNARAEETRAAMARLGGRKGYRSAATAIGVAKPFLAYKDINRVADTLISLIGPGGDAEPELRKLLEIAQADMASATIDDAKPVIATYKDRFSGVTGRRPKFTSEVLRNALIDPAPLKGDLSGPAFPAEWTDVYARDGRGGVSPELPILRRDARGYAAFPALPEDARDSDGDGLADIDDLGRFLSKAGKPLKLTTPFVVLPSGGDVLAKDARDPLGRALNTAGTPLYRYQDSSKTLLHAVLIDSKTLADPKNGALLDLLYASTKIFGPRTAPDAKDPTRGKDIATYKNPDGGPDVKIAYRKYDADQSPLTDLMYALGQTATLPKMADYLELFRQLTRDQREATARLIGAALAIRELANKPEYNGVNLDPKSGFWDDMVAVVAKIAAEPDLLKDVLDATADPDILILANGMSKFNAMKDQLDYNPAADSDPSKINDAVFNVTTGKAEGLPVTPTDLSTPDAGDNRSLFQRFASLIYDAGGVRACNKPGAKIKTKLGPIPVNLPLFGTYDECEVLNIPDLAAFYLGCIAGGTVEGTTTPRCKLPVTDGFVSALNSIIGESNVSNLLESSSGIKGLRQTPTVTALNRMVMWRNPSDFVNSLVDPIATRHCPISGSKGTRKCAPEDLIRVRQRGTIFMGESLDALKGLRPLVLPFVKKRGTDKHSRESYFVDLIGALHQHWSSGTDPARCSKTGTPADNPKWCWGDNVRQYEKLISEAMAGDMLPAVHSLTRTVRTLNIRGRSGTDVMVDLVRDLVQPELSKTRSLKTRKGETSTLTNDGRTIDQVTPFYLFANALNGMDAQWVGSDGEKLHALWRSARSRLVDQFLAIEAPGGDLSKSRMANKALEASVPILVDLLEDRIEEHRAAGDLETWASTGMPGSLSKTLSGPIFASAIDLQSKIYLDKNAKETMGNLLVYLLDQASANDALPTMVTASQDFLQLVSDDKNLVPIFHALATASSPDGALKRSLDMLKKVRDIEAGETWSAAHGGRRVFPRIMANAVVPLGKNRPAPIEILIDLVADIHRADPTARDSFAGPDYGSVAKNVQSFLVDPTRGLEQFYAIIKNRF